MMSILNKLKRLSYASMVLLMVASGSNLSYAEELYPLEDGEKLVEQRQTDDRHTEIFTQLHDDYYVKKLERSDSGWKVIDTELISPKWTGLEVTQDNKQGDRNLARSLETKLRSYGLGPSTLPPVVDFSQSDFLPPVGDQEQLNSCVGWSVGYYLRTFQQAKDIGWDVKDSDGAIASHVFSPSFIYNQINRGQDNGTSLTAAGNLLQDMGDATLEKFPYVTGDYLTQPSPEVKASAFPHRIREWKVLYTGNDSSEYIVSRIKEYLNTGDLVVAGSRTWVNLYRPTIMPNGNSIVTYDPFMFSQGHAYAVVGYDDTIVSEDGIGAFKIINSWGRQWGNQGFSYISYRAFTNYAMEGFVFTDLVNVTEQQLPVDTADAVAFQMNFTSESQFDVQIKGGQEQLVYEAKNLQATRGLNTLNWNGKNRDGAIAADGPYKVSIIPYKNGAPQTPFLLAFNKSGKVESASGSAYSYENVIGYVNIPVTYKSDGVMTLKVLYNNAEFAIISNETVRAGESKVYQIRRKSFDFNNKDLNQVRLQIDVK